ncbi:hypothetical protein [Modestobacter italicus]|uniref:hypothetical protein n=1 Tax=Modestobacter italicus (strain DSM 44449 / CECT 9708 / BC 501) TaxID=2732864 RepID=UPI001C96D3E2|nr:hypothetical protein [Modestobacter italicus]
MRAGLVLLLLGVVLTGCTGPIGRACTEMAVMVDVRVDTTALDLPAGATGRVCLDDECTDVVVGADPLSFYPQGVWWGRDVPDLETVQISLTLADPAGTQLWAGSAAVDTEVVEPNGPGCGQTTVLPELHATPDGRLRT